MPQWHFAYTQTSDNAGVWLCSHVLSLSVNEQLQLHDTCHLRIARLQVLWMLRLCTQGKTTRINT